MQKKENNPNLKPNVEYGGFLTTYVKEGDYLFIGDALIIIKEIKSNGLIVCIRAPKTYVIKKTAGESNG